MVRRVGGNVLMTCSPGLRSFWSGEPDEPSLSEPLGAFEVAAPAALASPPRGIGVGSGPSSPAELN